MVFNMCFMSLMLCYTDIFLIGYLLDEKLTSDSRKKQNPLSECTQRVLFTV